MAEDPANPGDPGSLPYMDYYTPRTGCTTADLRNTITLGQVLAGGGFVAGAIEFRGHFTQFSHSRANKYGVPGITNHPHWTGD